MAKTLRIPDEPRFVQAFALAVEPGDTLGLLLEIGALGSPDPSALLRTGVGIARRTREALIPAYDRASDLKNWEQAHTIGVLRVALAKSEPGATADHVSNAGGNGKGMPTAHEVDGKTFGGLVSGLAKSEPGAVAEHVRGK